MPKLSIDGYHIDKPLYDILTELRGQLDNGRLGTVEKPRGDWIKVTCPRHSDGRESNPSCGVYVGEDGRFSYGLYHCFTCGATGPFERFMAECMGCSEDYARRWLTANYGVRGDGPGLDLEEITLGPSPKGEAFLDESILDGYQHWHPYMSKRRLSRKVCEEFKVRYDPRSECLVFPVWDDRGRLLMLTRRSVRNKTFIIDKGKEKPVYLMNYVKSRGIKEVTVCESQINALTLWGYGIPAVATFGCSVTKRQMSVFDRSGVSHIYLCYDGDEAGRDGTERFLRMVGGGILTDVIVMDPGKDVNDISEERFNSLPILGGAEWLQKYGKGKDDRHDRLQSD